jgi:hypothetical protein
LLCDDFIGSGDFALAILERWLNGYLDMGTAGFEPATSRV